MSKRTAAAALMLGALLAAGPAATQPTTQPTTGPTTGPTAVAPTTQPAEAALALLDRVDAAYAKLTAATFAGTVAGAFDVGGQRHDESAAFTAAFAGPNRFRHATAGDVTVGSTGAQAYAYLARRDEYQTSDAPKARAASADWPAAVVGVLAKQDPSLLLAICPSAKAELLGWDKKPTVVEPTTIGDLACPTLRLDMAGDHQTVSVAFDPNTGLVRRATYDLRPVLEKGGAVDVKTATVTVDYATATTDGPADAAAFAWAPPAGAVLASANAADAGASDDPKDLVGSDAPAFTLKTPDGQVVRLADLKGKPVVLDFWATWCGPCIASLPHLDALDRELKERSPGAVAIYAVNATETEPDADAVGPFVKRKGWVLPVLLDADGSVSKAYRANAIPETVVIGKDGTVKQVFVGSGHEDEIKAAVARELK